MAYAFNANKSLAKTPPMAQAEDEIPSKPWTRGDYRALILCAAIGLVIAVLPHFASLSRYGTFQYLADGDDVLYLAVARIPANGESTLRDPFSRPSENVPSLYAWAQFVPLAKFATLIGLPPILISLLWRIIGGLLFGAALYALFRTILSGMDRAVWWALGCAWFCLSDAGFSTGRIVLDNLNLVLNMLRGTTPLLKADAIPQYRVVTPLLNLPFLILLIAVLCRLGSRTFEGRAAGIAGWLGSRREWLWAGTGIALLALCFYLYFFFWTAAVAGIGAYLLTNLYRAVRDPSGRTADLYGARFCLAVLVGGILLGAPQVYGNLSTFSDPAYQPILQRLSRGRDVSHEWAIRTQFIKNYWLWLKLAIGAIGILVFRLRGLTFLWWMTFAGYALACSALITGKEFENFHWSYVHAAFGEILVLAVIAQLAARYYSTLGKLGYALWVAPFALFLITIVWRPYEALRAPEAMWNSKTLEMMRPLSPALAQLGPDCVLAGPKQANVALLFTRCGQLYQFSHTSHSTMITDREVNERHALNAWLQGQSLTEYTGTPDEGLFQVGPSSNPAWEPSRIAGERARIFNALLQDPVPYLARYRPNALLLRGADVPPQQSGEWSVAQATNDWKLWVRR